MERASYPYMRLPQNPYELDALPFATEHLVQIAWSSLVTDSRVEDSVGSVSPTAMNPQPRQVKEVRVEEPDTGWNK